MRQARRSFVLALALFASVPCAAAEAPADEILVQSFWAKFRALPPKERPKVALVLGGGGARGLAHIGVLKVLKRENVPVDLVVGTSVGALAGALYAAGLPIEQIEHMGREVGWDELTDVSAARLLKLVVSEQLLRTEKMERYIERYIGDKKFAELPVAFACVAADLKTGERIVLREGDVGLAVRASATMPGFFSPVPYRHRLLVDGGLVDNVPVDVAKLLGADVVIAVGVPANFSKRNTSNVLMTLTQALYIQGEVLTQEQMQQSDVVIQPKVGDVSAMELWRSKECMEAGELAAREAMPALRRTLVKRFFERWAAALVADGGKP